MEYNKVGRWVNRYFAKTPISSNCLEIISFTIKFGQNRHWSQYWIANTIFFFFLSILKRPMRDGDETLGTPLIRVTCIMYYCYWNYFVLINTDFVHGNSVSETPKKNHVPNNSICCLRKNQIYIFSSSSSTGVRGNLFFVDLYIFFDTAERHYKHLRAVSRNNFHFWNRIDVKIVPSYNNVSAGNR